jgi:hypothetical protein
MRAGQGAYLDWVIGNAVLPDVDPDGSHTGIRKVDRSTVPELANIPSAFNDIQAQIDAADSGLNPVGVAQNAVPFDISPSELSGTNAKGHFEQIYSRAVDAMNNAIRVFNFAYNSSQKLRAQADDVAKFQDNVKERNADFKNRLIEIFGYPYPDDIGNGKTYPDDYDGPDLYHYMYFEPSELIGRRAGSTKELELDVLTKELKRLVGGSIPVVKRTKFNFSTEGFGFVKPAAWTLPRRAQGEIQLAHSEIMQAWGRYKRAVKEYDNLLEQIEDQNDVISAQDRLNSAEQSAGKAEVRILTKSSQRQQSINGLISQARGKQVIYQNRASYSTIFANAAADWVPETYTIPVTGGSGTAFNIKAPIRGSIRTLGAVAAQVFSEQAQDQVTIELEQQQAKEFAQSEANIEIVRARNGVIDDRGNAAIAGAEAQLKQLIRSKAILELDIYGMDAALEQATNRYLSALARGLRILDDQDRFQANTGSDVQQYRYKDMAFRIFRDDALQKYRAQFDLAARYVYLTAKAYDYETGLLDTDSKAAQAFLTQIVRSRALGTIEGGQPLTGGTQGDAGLADPMARMWQSWQVLKVRLGINNPSAFSTEFSLRYGLLRIAPGAQNNAVWREALQSYRVDNMLDNEEFRRFCIAPQGSGITPEPALMIPFETSINNTRNFFGWPLAGGDRSYPPTHLAVKIKAAGVGFSNYNSSIGTGLSATPYVYLVPAGLDTQRVLTDQLTIRSWQIYDQIIPTPFVLGESDLNNPNYLPQVDSLGIGKFSFGRMRQFPQMLAHDGTGGGFNTVASSTLSSRLVGRSVWNSRWLLIIPGSTFGGDPRAALEQLINGRIVGGVRDGNGISDIHIRFDSYSYSGN